MRRFTKPPKGPFSLDLHVLSTPPAFVLSQDQTLQFDSLKECVRPRGTEAPRLCTLDLIPSTRPGVPSCEGGTLSDVLLSSFQGATGTERTWVLRPSSRVAWRRSRGAPCLVGATLGTDQAWSGKGIRRRPTLPRSCPRSTIGARELNFRVRDGIGCGLPAIATGKMTMSARQGFALSSWSIWREKYCCQRERRLHGELWTRHL